jgi:exopolysaccharide/PEP-CTERM locus tyrosine autokinase
MSIIERVANLRRSPSQPYVPPVAVEGEAELHGPNLIERALNKKRHDPEFSAAGNEALEAVAEPLPEVAAAPAPRLSTAPVKNSRRLELDLEKLRSQNLLTPDSDRTPIAEGFRRIKRHILENMAHPKPGTMAPNLLMITSPLSGEGKTFCTINLAISIAMEIDRRVLLVDADVAKPSVPRVLGITAEQGLMDVLLDRRIDLADVLFKTNIEGLTLLPAGTENQNATEMLASESMRSLLQEMAERYHDRIIIFDSPPLLAASESAVLATRMGQIVMVVEAGKTTETELKDALSRIESCNLAGLLLNKGDAMGSGYYGGYGYGYGA